MDEMINVIIRIPRETFDYFRTARDCTDKEYQKHQSSAVSAVQLGLEIRDEPKKEFKCKY